ncbi:MAG: exo-alpha-sialidase [Promethearchaeota archaeon]
MKPVRTESRPPSLLVRGVIYPVGSWRGRPSAHASTIALGPKEGDLQKLYVTWFAGTGEGRLDVAVAFCEVTYEPDEVRTWRSSVSDEEFDPFDPPPGPFNYSKPRVIADDPNRACGNPVLYWDPSTGRFHLWYAAFYAKGSEVPPGEDPHRRDVFYKHSDDGVSWSEPVVWSDRPGLWVRAPLVVLRDGTWLLPINDEATYLPDFGHDWSSRFAVSRDRGKTWEFSRLYSVPKVPGRERHGMIQPSVVQLSDGSLYCLNRSHTGWMTQMRSAPGGRLGLDWTEPENSPLPNNNSGICVTRLRAGARSDDHLLVAYNPTTSERYPISIAESLDGGRTWRRLFDLRDEVGELSYPCLVQAPDGLLHCTYTLHRLTIAHDAFLL